DVVNADDVGVIQGRNRACLGSEAMQPCRIAGKAQRQYFDRNVAAETRIAGAIYLSHPALPHKRDDLVGPKVSAERPGILFSRRHTTLEFSHSRALCRRMPSGRRRKGVGGSACERDHKTMKALVGGEFPVLTLTSGGALPSP